MKAVLLRDVLQDLQSGSRPKGGVANIANGVPSIGGEHLNSAGGFNFENIKFVPQKFFESMRRGVISGGDVLVVKDGATTGKTSFVEGSFEFSKAAVNEHVFILRSNDTVEQKYLFYFLYSKNGQEEILKNFGGSAQGGINSRFVDNVSVPLPSSIEEQKRIVKKLDDAFAAIDKAKQNIEKNLQNSQELFEAKLNETFDQPKENWNSEKIGELFEIKPAKKEARDRLDLEDDVTFLPMEDLPLDKKETQPSKVKKLKEVVNSYTYFAEEDVLLAKITPCFENGKLAVARNLINETGFGSSEYIVLRNSGKVLPDLLYYFLRRKLFRVNGEKIMTGASGHRRVPIEYVHNAVLSFPRDLSEQSQLVEVLDTFYESTRILQELYRKKLTALEELRQSILKQAFEGRL